MNTSPQDELLEKLKTQLEALKELADTHVTQKTRASAKNQILIEISDDLFTLRFPINQFSNSK